MDKERKALIEEQVLLTLENDGDLYRRVTNYCRDGKFAKFVYFAAIAADRAAPRSIKMTVDERNYVVLELWDRWAGNTYIEGGDEKCFESYRDSACKAFKLKAVVPSKNSSADAAITAYYEDRNRTSRAGTEFDTSFMKEPQISRPNQGKIWNEEEEEMLRRAYHLNVSLKEMCRDLGRTPYGIVARLELLGLIVKDARTNTYYRSVAAKPTQSPQTTTKESIMAAINTNETTAFETKQIIFGQDATKMSEDDLIQAIKRVEGDIAKLKEVKTTSKKIAANIAAHEEQLAQIVAVLDAR